MAKKRIISETQKQALRDRLEQDHPQLAEQLDELNDYQPTDAEIAREERGIRRNIDGSVQNYIVQERRPQTFQIFGLRSGTLEPPLGQVEKARLLCWTKLDDYPYYSHNALPTIFLGEHYKIYLEPFGEDYHPRSDPTRAAQYYYAKGKIPYLPENGNCIIPWPTAFSNRVIYSNHDLSDYMRPIPRDWSRKVAVVHKKMSVIKKYIRTDVAQSKIQSTIRDQAEESRKIMEHLSKENRDQLAFLSQQLLEAQKQNNELMKQLIERSGKGK